jgi:hypothetical protein
VKVVLAVSSYLGDMAALDLVEVARSAPFQKAFDAIAVIDSGAQQQCALLRETLAAEHPDVEYHWHESNLGSAGNLVVRLNWAIGTGADAVLAVNADGVLVADNIARMLDCLRDTEKAAVYPTHIIEGQRVDLSCCRSVPILPSREPLGRLAGKRSIPVRWGSSNGALYRVDALQALALDGIASLWYGWEDLGLGLSLHAAGHRQAMSVEAVQPTRADQKHLSSTRLVVSAKEPWTTYYSVRNLLLLSKTHRGYTVQISLRVLREFVMIVLRDRRRQRYARALRGLLDGARGVTGEQIQPAG